MFMQVLCIFINNSKRGRSRDNSGKYDGLGANNYITSSIESRVTPNARDRKQDDTTPFSV